LKADPEHAKSHYRLGYLLEKSGNIKSAKEHYLAAIKNDSNLADAYLRLGNLDKKERPMVALQTLEKGLKLKPTDAEAFYDYGNILRDMKRLDEAHLAFYRAAELEPENDKAWYKLGSVLREKKEYDAARQAYRKAVSLESDNVDYQYKYASVLKDLEQWNPAVSEFRKVLKLDPDHEKALYKLASCLEKDGNIPAAREAYRNAAKRIKEDEDLKKRAEDKVKKLSQ
jgi:tetratricopeptide (TPR) repeat protein